MRGREKEKERKGEGEKLDIGVESFRVVSVVLRGGYNEVER